MEILCTILPTTTIEVLNLSRNFLGDESAILLGDALRKKGCKLSKLDVSGCRLNDLGAA